jgi:hypothetical protein
LTNERKAALLAELIAATSPPERQDDDVTIREYAEAARVPYNTAKHRLDKQVEAGGWATLLVFDPDTSRVVRVYRKA